MDIIWFEKPSSFKDGHFDLEWEGIIIASIFPMDQAEAQAIAACQRGELTQFTLLYELYVEKIYRFVYFKTLHRETAEDITSLVFMKALEHIGDYQVAKGSFSSWLYRIAQNTVIDHYRTAKPAIDIDQVWGLAAPHNLIEEVEVKRAVEMVGEYLKLLPPASRDLLIMRLWQGLSYQEMADLTGKSEGALKMAVSRALKQLRNNVVAVLFFAFIIVSLI